MNLLDATIKELNLIDDIERLEEIYIEETGIRPIKLSHWNPSSDFLSGIPVSLLMEESSNLIDYIFSYSIASESKTATLKRLGFSSPDEKSCLFTHAGSASIFSVINFLRCNEISRLHLVCPSYFTVRHAANCCNIECFNHYFTKDTESTYELLQMPDPCCLNRNEAIWITNPIYCTSVYYTASTIDYIEKALKNGVMVVIDECLAKADHSLAGRFEKYPNFTGIYSPHKTICTNGNKFSVIVSDKKNQNFFDSWSDILCGCLSSGNQLAINHYLSNNFMDYETEFHMAAKRNFEKVKKLCDKYLVGYDKNANGYLVTIYFSHISAQRGWDISFMKKVLERTGSTFIPGIRNHFHDSLGFCFRLNLAAWSVEYSYALERCMKLLSAV